MMISLIQVTEVKDILSIENVSIFGLMLLIIIALVYHVKKLEAKHEKEKDELQLMIKESNDRLESEYQSSSKEMKEIIGKYYEVVTKVLEKINTIIK